MLQRGSYIPYSSFWLFMGVNTNDTTNRDMEQSQQEAADFRDQRWKTWEPKCCSSQLYRCLRRVLGRSWCLLQVNSWLHNCCCSWCFGFFNYGHLYGIWTVSKRWDSKNRSTEIFLDKSLIKFQLKTPDLRRLWPLQYLSSCPVIHRMPSFKSLLPHLTYIHSLKVPLDAELASAPTVVFVIYTK